MNSKSALTDCIQMVSKLRSGLIRSIKSVLRRLFGGRVFQPLLEKLHRSCLISMNIGGGGDVQNSGELWVLDYLWSIQFGKAGTPVIIFDVGANVGDYAIEVLRRFEDRVQLYCFEPGQWAFDSLKDKFDSRNNVHLVNMGIGEQEELLTLYSAQAGSVTASFHARCDDIWGGGAGKMPLVAQVSVTTMDLFCKRNNIDEIDLLKLDVEGHEFMALTGAQQLLRSRRINAIQFEFGMYHIYSRTFFLDFFELLNPTFRIYRILRRGLEPIEVYKPPYEVFVTTNFLALSRDLYKTGL